MREKERQKYVSKSGSMSFNEFAVSQFLTKEYYRKGDEVENG
jgi:hypothetical protein